MRRFIIAIIAIVAIVAVAVLAPASQARADRFEVVAYNTWLRPTILFPSDAQRLRAGALAQELTGYDAVVLAEVFDAHARQTVLRGLAARGYRYTTHRLGADGVFTKNGGVLIASRWPIVAEAQQLFQSCANTNLCVGQHCLVGDCNAHKGVLYAAIMKRGRRYHLFGSHAQASDRPAARRVRAEQMRAIRAFIESRHIPAGEPVIIAGDLNVDRFGAPEEYRRTLQVLGARPPQHSAGLPYSWDPMTNAWAKEDAPGDPRQMIDHILISRTHLQPTDSVLEVRAIRADGHDLSDHHAVYARLEFPPAPPRVADAPEASRTAN